MLADTNMELKPPDGFVSLNKASTSINQLVRVIGVVTDYLPPKKSSGTDWGCTFSLQDLSMINGTSQNPALRVRMFRSQENYLPHIEALGDVVVIRNLRIRNDTRFGLIGISCNTTEEIHFPASRIPIPELKETFAGGKTLLGHTATPPGCHLPTLAEQMYAIALHHALPSPTPLFASNNFVIPPPTGPKSKVGVKAVSNILNQKYSLIKDLGPQQYADLIGEVVKIYPGMTEVDIYITDYTENSFLYLYRTPEELAADGNPDGDSFGYTTNGPKKQWQGPFGQMTLPVRLWYPHADWTRQNIREGEVVLLRNTHIKFSQAGKLEGALHQDMKFPEQVDVRKFHSNPQDSRLDDLKKRKADYESRHGAVSLDAALGGKNKVLKKKPKRQKAQKPKPEHITLDGQEKGPTISTNLGHNQHIRSGYTDIRITPVSDILENPHLSYKTPTGIESTLPFINAKYRARVRVVDFWPPNLEDFSRRLDNSDYCPLASNSVSDSGSEADDSEIRKKWEWAFSLLVEDATTPSSIKEAPSRMNLVVAQDGAEFLLKMDAVDLREDTRALNQLKEILFILWGDLEELKSSNAALPPHPGASRTASSNPFECCIQEYGVAVPTPEGGVKWQRMHRMFATTVI